MKYIDVYRMKKTAEASNIYYDMGGALGTTALLGAATGGLGALADMGGELVGYLDPMKEKVYNEEYNVKDVIPGRFKYRYISKLNNSAAANGAKSPRKLTLSERYGGIISGLPTLYLSEPIARLAALISRTRTNEEQKAVDTDENAVLKNLLIPGRATYNKFKRIGNIRANEKAAEDKKDKVKKK